MYECEYECVHVCECACRQVQVSIQMWVCERVDGGEHAGLNRYVLISGPLG